MDDCGVSYNYKLNENIHHYQLVGGAMNAYLCLIILYLVVRRSCHTVSLSHSPVCISSVSRDVPDAVTASRETRSRCELSQSPSQTEIEPTITDIVTITRKREFTEFIHPQC